MAHNAKLADLTAKLIQSLTDDRSNQLKTRKTLRSLKEHNFARTNQFAVRARLDGLDEKFIVFGRDELAEALRLRLARLPQGDKFLPDKLALLLSLSDRPHETVTLDNLHELNRKQDTSASELTWEDIIRDDPREPDLWENIQPGYHSSADEDETPSDEESPATSVDAADDAHHLADLQLRDVDNDGYRAWKSNIASSLTEHDLIRESLLMLRGLSSVVYNVSTGIITPASSIATTLATPPGLQDLLADLAYIGTRLSFLRLWSQSIQDQSHVRACQSQIQLLLRHFRESLLLFEQPEESVCITLLGVLDAVRRQSRSLLELASIIQDSTSRLQDRPFLLLDQLYDAISTAYAAGLPSEELNQVFVAALCVYLRPVTTWCTTGNLVQQDDFFIKDSRPHCDRAHLWTKRFELVRIDNESETTPSFFSAHLQAIFETGKQKMFASMLQGPVEETSSGIELHSRLVTMLVRLAEQPTADFSSVFHATVSDWVTSMAQQNNRSISTSLFHDHGLMQALDAYQGVFLAINGAVSAQLCQTLAKSRSRHVTQHETAAYLTRVLRAAISPIRHIETSRLSIAVDDRVVKDSIGHLSIHYALSWPLRNIINPATEETYSAVWTMLMQAQQSQQVLQASTIALRTIRSDAGHIAAILRLRFYLLATLGVIVSHVKTVCNALHTECVARLVQAADMDDLITIWTRHCEQLAIAAMLDPSLQTVHADLQELVSLSDSAGVAWQSVINGTSLSKAMQVSTGKQLAQMLLKYQRLVGSIVDGLRGFTRSGQQHATLSDLADQLELCSQ